MSTFQEKRKYARLDIRSKINFSIQETPEKETPLERFRGIGKNIGAEGLLFSCDKKLATGTLLDLEIIFSKKPDPIYLTGKVRWCKEIGDSEKKTFEVGVQFSSINKNHVLLLIKYVCGNLSVDEISSLN